MHLEADTDSDVGAGESKPLASFDILGLNLEPDTDSGDGVAASNLKP